VTITLRRCPLCHRTGIARKKVDRSYQVAGTRRVVRDVEAQHCPHCGETFLDVLALDRIDRVLGLKRPRRRGVDAA